jgi:hypothetical protein
MKGVGARIFEAMSDDPDFEYLIVYSLDRTVGTRLGARRLHKYLDMALNSPTTTLVDLPAPFAAASRQ